MKKSVDEVLAAYDNLSEEEKEVLKRQAQENQKDMRALYKKVEIVSIVIAVLFGGMVLQAAASVGGIGIFGAGLTGWYFLYRYITFERQLYHDDLG